MRLVLILGALLLTPTAAAQNYDEAPDVTVRRAGNGGEARATMDVRAPPVAVWEVLSDCAHARRIMQELLSCRVLERGEGWEVREHRVRGWPFRPVMRNVARLDLEPNRRLAFHRVAGDWSESEGEWLLTPIDGGRGTRIEYNLNAALAGGVPAALSRPILLNRIRRTLAALRREAEAQQ